jgi:heme exporter protein A
MRLLADNIACSRGGRQVFAGLSFTVGTGEALLVTGRNGAGKSSLLRAIAGLVRLSGGRLVLEPAAAESAIAERSHYLGHQDAVKPALSVAENLGFWADYLGGKGRPATALRAVGLGAIADLPAAYLSAGQRRRLAIARLLTAPRPIWLLDEPTAALDREAQVILAGLMRQHLAGAGLIIAAAHGPIGLDRTNELRLGAAR